MAFIGRFPEVVPSLAWNYRFLSNYSYSIAMQRRITKITTTMRVYRTERLVEFISLLTAWVTQVWQSRWKMTTSLKAQIWVLVPLVLTQNLIVYWLVIQLTRLVSIGKKMELAEVAERASRLRQLQLLGLSFQTKTPASSDIDGKVLPNKTLSFSVMQKAMLSTRETKLSLIWIWSMGSVLQNCRLMTWVGVKTPATEISQVESLHMDTIELMSRVALDEVYLNLAMEVEASARDKPIQVQQLQLQLVWLTMQLVPSRQQPVAQEAHLLESPARQVTQVLLHRFSRVTGAESQVVLLAFRYLVRFSSSIVVMLQVVKTAVDFCR